MKPHIPLRTHWRATVRAWPAPRNEAFEQQLTARRLAKPEETEDWAFVATFRAFRATELDDGRMTFAEAYPGTAEYEQLRLRELEAGRDEAIEYQRKLEAVVGRRPRRSPESPAQLRLVVVDGESRRWDGLP